MSWSKIDDLLPHHRKVRGMSGAFAAFGLYVASICFAQRELTDGVVLRTDLPALIPGNHVRAPFILALTASRLWDELDDGRDGWRVHDYLDHNDSAANRRAKLSADSDRKRAGRSGRNPSGVQTESERRPDVAPLLSSPLLSDRIPPPVLRTESPHGKRSGPDRTPSDPASWPDDLREIRQWLGQHETLDGFDDPVYWRRIDAWLGAPESGVAYLPELAKYLAWEIAIPARSRPRDRRRAFRNWLAKSEHWSQSRAQTAAIKRRR